MIIICFEHVLHIEKKIPNYFATSTSANTFIVIKSHISPQIFAQHSLPQIAVAIATDDDEK